MVSWALFCWLCPGVAISPLNAFSGVQMVGGTVLKPISCMATPPKPPKAKSIPHFSIYTLRTSSKLQGFMIPPACFSMVESSHPKYSQKRFSLPSHDWAGKLEQWPGHHSRETVSLKYGDSVIPSTQTNAFLWYSEWKPAMLAEDLVRQNITMNTYLVKITVGLIFFKFQLWNQVKS